MLWLDQCFRASAAKELLLKIRFFGAGFLFFIRFFCLYLVFELVFYSLVE